MGDAYVKSGIYDDAVGAYKSALDKDPTDIETMVALADIFYKTKNYPDAINYYEKSIKLSSGKNADAYFRLGECYILQQNNDQAKKVFSELKTKFPKYENIGKVDSYLSGL